MKIMIIGIITIMLFLVYAVIALLKGNVYIKKMHLSRKNGFNITFEKNETSSIDEKEDNSKDEKNEEPPESSSRSKKK